MGRVQVFCFLACYVVVFGIELSRFLGRNRAGRAIMLVFTMAGLIAHTAYLLARSQKLNLPPLLSSSQDWLLVLAWLSVVSYFVLTISDADLAVGVFLMPVVLACISAAYFVSDNPNMRLSALRGWKLLHASLLVLGMLGVIVGFVLAMMYLFQQHRLKHRHALTRGF
jgi:ABC-type transport system involved in cytochrome c biogenesis permease subunit